MFTASETNVYKHACYIFLVDIQFDTIFIIVSLPKLKIDMNTCRCLVVRFEQKKVTMFRRPTWRGVAKFDITVFHNNNGRNEWTVFDINVLLHKCDDGGFKVTSFIKFVRLTFEKLTSAVKIFIWRIRNSPQLSKFSFKV